jgi:hypothetical protein
MKRTLIALAVLSSSFAVQSFEIPDFENVSIMTKKTPLNKLNEMEKLTSTEIHQPWSGYYWAFAKGVLGLRYRDQEMMDLFTNLASFRVMHKYARKEDDNKPENYIYRGKIDELSPSEKYDLLVGDHDYTLTDRSWEYGKDVLASRLGFGAVPIWRGICHGWSPASFSTPRPTKVVTLTGANGHKIPFYPEDIKALSSMLWAKGNYDSHFLGKRCGSLAGTRSESCIGLNPGALHMLLVNRIGVDQNHFVLDMDPGSEVWNYPVFAYEYNYFQPLTGKTVTSISEATVNLMHLKEDHPLRKHRSDRARSIVGIKMKVKYPEMSNPKTLDYDEPSLDDIKTKTFEYDLELDYQGKIVGGEYYTNEKPDFAWAPKKSEFPSSLADSSVKWVEGTRLSESKMEKLKKASTKGQPLKEVVELLVNAAKE